MKRMLIVLGFVVLSLQVSAKNVVLFIGDGMGPAQVTATRNYLAEQDKTLFFDSLPQTALVKTRSADSIVTDSAASATAFACGELTNNGVIGQDKTAVYGQKDGNPLKSIAYLAKEKGMSVGIVTTTRITHATPAAFYAQVNDRDKEPKIADQLIESGFDVFLGGGQQYFGATSKRLKKLKTHGYQYITSTTELKELNIAAVTKLVGLFNDSHLAFDLDRERQISPEPSLEELTLTALSILKKNPRGFFLMVEGGRIDHASHDNQARHAIGDTIAMNKAVKAVTSHVDEGETLVLVTADHETGGLAINGYPDADVPLFGFVKEGGQQLEYPVLTWSTGPGAGIFENGKWRLKPAEPNAEGLFLEKNPAKYYLELSAHTGVDVVLYGWGAKSSLVHGTIGHVDIFKLMQKTL